MEFLIFGTVWFWILFLGASFLIIWFLENALGRSKDSGGGMLSTITLIAAIAVYYFLGSSQDVINFFLYVKDHPIFSLLRVGAYIGIGLVWSIFKWYFFLRNKAESLTAQMDEYPASTSFSEKDFPKAKDNKARIISWMSYWPFSAFWTLLNEPIKKTYKYIYSKIEGLYDKMTEKIFAELKKKIQDRLDSRKEYDKKNNN